MGQNSLGTRFTKAFSVWICPLVAYGHKPHCKPVRTVIPGYFSGYGQRRTKRCIRKTLSSPLSPTLPSDQMMKPLESALVVQVTRNSPYSIALCVQFLRCVGLMTPSIQVTPSDELWSWSLKKTSCIVPHRYVARRPTSNNLDVMGGGKKQTDFYYNEITWMEKTKHVILGIKSHLCAWHLKCLTAELLSLGVFSLGL